jgi:hypothetical protein
MNERVTGADWNPIWDREAGRFEGGWIAETAIPFKSLRYKQATAQVWGFNIRRTIRWKNEESYLVKLPVIAGASGAAAIFQISNAATVVGIEAPAASKNIEIKPYALSNVSTNRLARPAVSNAFDGDFGVDAKYGVTKNLTADFTYNTDFAQVEVDAQQVNLTRFSLFYPEKREFFLEGQGIFDFGGAVSSSASGKTPLLFFSRRIGLTGGTVIPLHVGGRLTGRVGRYTLGIVDVQTGEDELSVTPSTNFSVFRLKRDIFRRSNVGVLFTGRSNSSVAVGSAQTYGVDAVLRPQEFLTVNAYLAKTSTPGSKDDDLSYRINGAYSADRYGLELEQSGVGDNFIPDVGYLQRDNYQRSYALARFSPRPKSMASVRKFSYQGMFEYYADGSGRMETRDVSPQFGIEFQNGDTVNLRVDDKYEFLARPFAIAPGVIIGTGGYSFFDGQLQLGLGPQRRVSGTLSVEGGTFYNGTRKTVGFSSGRVLFSPRFSFEPGASINWIDLDEGEFTSTVLSNRVTFTFTPLMFFSGLVQYNSTSKTVGSNFRLRWEYQPGSELFVVYTDELDTLGNGYPNLRNRAFVVKVNRLFRF